MIKTTPEVRAFMEESGIENGLAYVITERTTTGTTVNESLDYVEKDTMEYLSRIAPGDYPHRHSHYLPTYETVGGNTPGHLKSLLVGNRCVFSVVRGELKLGHTMDIYFCEYDGVKMCHYMTYTVKERKEQNMKRTITMADNYTDVYHKLDRYYPTGNSTDFASSYRGLGGDVMEVATLDDDVFAMVLEERPKGRGIAPRILKHTDRPTGMATMDIVDGDKKHLHFEGNAMEGIEPSGEDLEFVKFFDIVYTKRWFRIDRYIKGLKQPGQVWIYDFSKRLEQEGNNLILLYLDCAFFPYDRDDSYIGDFMIKVRKRGADTVIAMLGEHGSLAYGGGRLYEEGAEKVPVVSTVGAGDSYITTFTHGVSLREPISQCMDRGKRRATEVIRQLNPYK